MLINLLFVTYGLGIGGAEKFAISLLNSLNKEKFNLTLITLSADNPLQIDLKEHINFLVFPRKNKFDVSPIKKLRSFINNNNPDKIICINFFSFFVLALATLFLKKNKFISYHTTVQKTQKQHYLTKFYTTFLQPKDLIITVSNNQALYTAQTYNIGRNLFTTIHNGVNTNWWLLPPNTQSKLEVRSNLGIPKDAFVIIMTAAFRPEKNHQCAINALNILHQKYKFAAYLLLVGDGEMRKAAENLTDVLNLYPYVKFVGLQTDVRPYYWASDLFTLTSHSVETFSIAALEAMACGLPCVLTDIGGAREMIIDNYNGLICEPTETDIAEKWYLALNTPYNSIEINKLIRNKFSLEKMVEAYTVLLES